MTNDETGFNVMAAALADRGLITPDQIASDRAAMAAGNTSPSDPATAPALEQALKVTAATTPEPSDLDASIFAGPASPAAYNFGTPPVGFERDEVQETAMRQLFHSEGIPVPIGNELNRLYTAAMVNPPSPDQVEMARRQAVAQLSRRWGGDYQKNLGIVQSEVNRMEAIQPGVKHMLDASGLGNNLYVIETLVNMAKAKGRA